MPWKIHISTEFLHFCIHQLYFSTTEIVVSDFLYHDHPPGMICMANAGEHAYARVRGMDAAIVPPLMELLHAHPQR